MVLTSPQYTSGIGLDPAARISAAVASGVLHPLDLHLLPFLRHLLHPIIVRTERILAEEIEFWHRTHELFKQGNRYEHSWSRR